MLYKLEIIAEWGLRPLTHAGLLSASPFKSLTVHSLKWEKMTCSKSNDGVTAKLQSRKPAIIFPWHNMGNTTGAIIQYYLTALVCSVGRK